MNEYEYEPIPGLPEELPDGEEILWQGKPDWRVLANQAFHIRELTAYFALFLSARGVVAFMEGEGLLMSVLSALAVAPLAAAGTGLIALFAWLHARTTIYTITNRRVVFRYGVALQLCFNIPFKMVESAALKVYESGHGEIPLALKESAMLGYINLWPHVRPWRFAKAQPMLRAIPDAACVGALLVDAMVDATEGQPAEVKTSTVTESSEPVVKGTPALVAVE